MPGPRSDRTHGDDGPARAECDARRRARPIPAKLLAGIEAMGMRATEAFWATHAARGGRTRAAARGTGGDGLLTLCANSDALRLNRVVGLGHRGEAKRGADRRDHRTLPPPPAAAVQHRSPPGRRAPRSPPGSPSADPPATLAMPLLVRDARRPIAALPTDLRVAKATRGDAETIVAIHEQSFAGPPSRRPWALAGTRSCPGWSSTSRGRAVCRSGRGRCASRASWRGSRAGDADLSGGATAPTRR